MQGYGCRNDGDMKLNHFAGYRHTSYWYCRTLYHHLHIPHLASVCSGLEVWPASKSFQRVRTIRILSDCNRCNKLRLPTIFDYRIALSKWYYPEETIFAQTRSAMDGFRRYVRLGERYAVGLKPKRQAGDALTYTLSGVNEKQSYPQCQQHMGLGWCCTEAYASLRSSLRDTG